MTKFLYCAPPRYGHVIPVLSIIKEMVDQGAEVTYFCIEKFTEVIQAAGATFRPYQTTIEDDFFAQSFSFLESSDPTINECFYVLPQILEVARAENADCIIYDDFCLWGRILVQILQLPAIIVLSSYARNEHFNHLSYSHEILDIDAPAITATQDMRESLEKLCQTYNIEPFPYEDIFFHTEALNIIRMPRELHPMGETFDPKRFKFVGPTIRSKENIGDFPLDRLGDKPVLFGSLGTVFNGIAGIFDLFLSAFGHQSQQLILALGSNIDPSVFGPLPDNVILHSQVPQLEVLRHTDIFITHGGINGVMEALAYGVPMVVIPQGADHITTAFHLQKLKLGIMLDQTAITVHTLRTAVSILRNNPIYRTNAQSMQQVIQQFDGAVEAAGEILNYSSSIFANK